MTGQVIWITGLSGAGKTTLSEELNIRFRKNNVPSILLDGDALRNIYFYGAENTQSYTRNARINLAFKYSLLCKNLSDQGFTVIIATISMFNEIYVWNKKNLKNYFEVYLKVPLAELYLRDHKKIYQRYKDGKLKNVAGLDLTVDEPVLADLIYDFDLQPFLWDTPKNLINSLIDELEKRSFLFEHKI